MIVSSIYRYAQLHRNIAESMLDCWVIIMSKHSNILVKFKGQYSHFFATSGTVLKFHVVMKVRYVL